MMQGGEAAAATGWNAGMSKRYYYEVLEVERAANDGELKAAFRKLAMKWHPDRNPGDKDCEHRFKEINEAYEVLKDRATSAPPMTASATPPSSKGGGGARLRRRLRLRLLRHLRGHLRHGRRARPPRRPRARRRSALQHGDQPRGGLQRQDRAGAAADLGHLRSPAPAPAPRPAPSRRPVRTAAAPAASATRRASSRWSAPARAVRAAAR